MSEEQGQVAQQPVDLHQAALAIVQKDPEFAPRGEDGKFKSTKPETQAEAPAEQTEEAPAEEVVEEAPEVDWDKIKTYKRKLVVKGEDGSDQEVELALEDMEKGVMLERAFRMKTAQLAREKETVHAKIKEAVEPKLKEYEEKLDLAEQVIWHSLGPEIKSIDWNKLAQENPAEWAQKYQQVQNINAQLAKIQSEKQKISETRANEQKEALQKAAREAVEVLQTEVPGWNNDLYGKILKTAVEMYGFKAEEANAITDPRAIKVLNDARQWREFKAAKPATVDKKVTTVPKVVKPGTAEKPDPSADKWKEGMANLRKAGGRNTPAAVTLAKMLLEKDG